MAEELVRLTNQNDEMEGKVKEIPKLRIQLKVSTKRSHPYFHLYSFTVVECFETCFSVRCLT